jgi:hypothetical protein
LFNFRQDKFFIVNFKLLHRESPKTPDAFFA